MNPKQYVNKTALNLVQIWGNVEGNEIPTCGTESRWYNSCGLVPL